MKCHSFLSTFLVVMLLLSVFQVLNLPYKAKAEESKFGCETEFEGHVCIAGMIVAGRETCPEAGTADSITVYLDKDFVGAPVQCALYDSSLNLVENGVTEEKNIDKIEIVWETKDLYHIAIHQSTFGEKSYDFLMDLDGNLKIDTEDLMMVVEAYEY